VTLNWLLFGIISPNFVALVPVNLQNYIRIKVAYLSMIHDTYTELIVAAQRAGAAVPHINYHYDYYHSGKLLARLLTVLSVVS